MRERNRSHVASLWSLVLIAKKDRSNASCSFIRSCLEYHRRSHVSSKKSCLGRSFVPVWHFRWWFRYTFRSEPPLTCERIVSYPAMNSDEELPTVSRRVSSRIYGDCDAPVCKRKWRSRAGARLWRLILAAGRYLVNFLHSSYVVAQLQRARISRMTDDTANIRGN